jgi:hypothetical protein
MTDTQTLFVAVGVCLFVILMIVLLHLLVGSKKIAEMEQERRMLDK